MDVTSTLANTTELVGLTVAEKSGRCEANEKVLEILHATGSSSLFENYKHSYPLLAVKPPVVFRAMDQWFVSLDKDDLRGKAVTASDGVRFIPKFGMATSNPRISRDKT